MGVLGESRGLKDVRLKAIKLLEELKEILKSKESRTCNISPPSFPVNL